MFKRIILIFLLQITTLYAQNNKIIPYCLNNKIGFVDEFFNVLKEPSFASLEQWNNNNFILYSLNKQNKVLFNKYGSKNVQDVILLDNGYYSSYQGYDTLIYNEAGNCIRTLHNLQHDHNSSYNYIIVFDGEKENIITVNNLYIFDDKNILELYNYDPKTETALCRYKSKGYCLVKKNAIKNKEKFLFGIRSFNEGAVFGKNIETGETGFYNMDCKLIIKAEILKDTNIDDWNYFPSISDDVLSFVHEDNSYIFLSKQQVYHSSNWIITDKNGNIISKSITADYIYPFSDNVAVYKLKINDNFKYGLINKKGEIITTTLYDEINSSVNGYCMAKKNNVDYLISSNDGTVYLCNSFK